MFPGRASRKHLYYPRRRHTPRASTLTLAPHRSPQPLSSPPLSPSPSPLAGASGRTAGQGEGGRRGGGGGSARREEAGDGVARGHAPQPVERALLVAPQLTALASWG